MENLNFHIDTSLAATPFVSDTLKGGKTIVITFPEGKASAVFIQQSADGATWRTKHSVSSTPSATVNVEASSDTYLRVLVSERPQSSSYKDYSGGGGTGTEVDPTVPSWAKQPQKPTYTAAEVGAASKTELDTLSLEVENKKVNDASVSGGKLTITKDDGSQIEFEGGGDENGVKTINGSAPDENGNINVAVMTPEQEQELEQAIEMADKLQIHEDALGSYTPRASIVIEADPELDGYAIDATTAMPKAKAGWAVSKPFRIERGDTYLIGLGQTDGGVWCLSKVTTTTWDEPIIDPDTGEVIEVITHYEHHYEKMAQLNADAELPTDGRLRKTGLPNSYDAVVSYHKASVNPTIEVRRYGTLADLSTQIGNDAERIGDLATGIADVSDSVLEAKRLILNSLNDGRYKGIYRNGQLFDVASQNDVDVTNIKELWSSPADGFSYMPSTNLKRIDALYFDCKRFGQAVFQTSETHGVIYARNWNFPIMGMTEIRAFSKAEYADTSNWNTEGVTILNGAPFACDLDMSSWDGSSLTKVNHQSFTSDCVGGRSYEDVVRDNVAILRGYSVATTFIWTTMNHASVRALINGLADLTGQESKTLAFRNEWKLLTEADIAVATAKNWVIAKF